MQAFDNLLAQYVNIHKAVYNYTAPSQINNPLPCRLGYRMRIPYPKSYRPLPSPYIPPFQPNTYQNYPYDAPTRHYTVQCLATTELFDKIFHMYDEVGNKASIDSIWKGSLSEVWGHSLSNELVRIAQGLGNVKGNDAVDYIPKSEVLLGCIVTYANCICDYAPSKVNATVSDLQLMVISLSALMM